MRGIPSGKYSVSAKENMSEYTRQQYQKLYKDETLKRPILKSEKCNFQTRHTCSWIKHLMSKRQNKVVANHTNSKKVFPHDIVSS